MVGKQVDAELYKLPDGQLRASHVRVSRPVLENVDDEGMPALEGQADEDPEPWNSLGLVLTVHGEYTYTYTHNSHTPTHTIYIYIYIVDTRISVCICPYIPNWNM